MRVPWTTSELIESKDRRVVDLSHCGFPEIPVLGTNRTSTATEGSVYHRHRGCFEITLCLRGSAKFDCDGKVWTLMPGMVFVSRPHDVHRLKMNQRGARLNWLFLKKPQEGETMFGLPLDETRWLIGWLERIPRRMFSVSDNARCAFDELFAAYDAKTDSVCARKFRIRLAALKLVSEMLGGMRFVASVDDSDAFTALIAKMRRNPQDEYGEDKLVAETQCSPNTILSRFRRITGLPPHAFLVKCRIHRARELLKAGWPVTKVASELHFASSQHFATRFRQEMGMSPTEWIRNGFADVQKNAKLSC